jgi:hypothetical protein
MSDDWIASVRTLAFGALLAATVHNAEVKTIVLEGGNFPGHSQERIHSGNALQALQGAADLAQEQAGPALADQAWVNPPQEGPDEAQQPQGNEEQQKELDTLDDQLEDLEDVVERATETEEDRRRESSEMTLELLQAREEDLAALLDRKKQERAGQQAMLAEQEEHLKAEYAGSPEADRHLANLHEVARATEREMGERHDAERQQLEERWQQKFQQFQEQPLIMPTDPGRDDR